MKKISTPSSKHDLAAPPAFASERGELAKKGNPYVNVCMARKWSSIPEPFFQYFIQVVLRV